MLHSTVVNDKSVPISANIKCGKCVKWFLLIAKMAHTCVVFRCKSKQSAQKSAMISSLQRITKQN